MPDRSDADNTHRWLERQASPDRLAASVVRSRILRPVYWRRVEFSFDSSSCCSVFRAFGVLVGVAPEPLLFCARESVGVWSLKTA